MVTIDFKTGVELITAERVKQLNARGYNIRHDMLVNQHDELRDAAMFLMTGDKNYFPKSWDEDIKAKWYNYDRIKCLTIAGALIAAYIDQCNIEEALDRFLKA